MPPHDERETVVNLERTNAKLRESLKACRAILADYRAMLAANSNDQPLFRWTEREEARANRPAREPKGES